MQRGAFPWPLMRTKAGVSLKVNSTPPFVAANGSRLPFRSTLTALPVIPESRIALFPLSDTLQPGTR